eukprot:Rhum_TRINITY_DN10721_c0_g1::Rhum_TRINITY_DN10721_c0_g1_i1::g.39917::m.39917
MVCISLPITSTRPSVTFASTARFPNTDTRRASVSIAMLYVYVSSHCGHSTLSWIVCVVCFCASLCSLSTPPVFGHTVRSFTSQYGDFDPFVPHSPCAHTTVTSSTGCSTFFSASTVSVCPASLARSDGLRPCVFRRSTSAPASTSFRQHSTLPAFAAACSGVLAQSSPPLTRAPRASKCRTATQLLAAAANISAATPVFVPLSTSKDSNRFSRPSASSADRSWSGAAARCSRLFAVSSFTSVFAPRLISSVAAATLPNRTAVHSAVSCGAAGAAASTSAPADSSSLRVATSPPSHAAFNACCSVAASAPSPSPSSPSFASFRLFISSPTVDACLCSAARTSGCCAAFRPRGRSAAPLASRKETAASLPLRATSDSAVCPSCTASTFASSSSSASAAFSAPHCAARCSGAGVPLSTDSPDSARVAMSSAPSATTAACRRVRPPLHRNGSSASSRSVRAAPASACATMDSRSAPGAWHDPPARKYDMFSPSQKGCNEVQIL